MKVVMIIGSHPRHAYVARRMAEATDLVGVVIQQREGFERDDTRNIDEEYVSLYEKHFALRAQKEKEYFGGYENFDFLRENYAHLDIVPSELNTQKTVDFLEKLDADILFAYGPDIIMNNILNMYNDKAFNIHGGLSPWYKGSATMFWPFYNLEPNYVGTTIHHMTNKIDAGRIIHQVVPELSYGDTLHDVACKAIVATCNEFKPLITAIEEKGSIEGSEQRKNGKLFLDKDWRPEHLRLIYELYEDAIVDRFLEGKIGKDNKPNLIRAF